jgi:hypothetical protein
MSNIRTITGFKSKLAGGGARPNLFEVNIPQFPLAAAGAAWDQETFNFLCKAAALPASNIAPIDVPFRGRILKVAGDRTFDTWTVTVINDEDFKLRTAFELWMNGISKLDNNTGATNPASYMTNAIVHQLGRGGSSRMEASTTNFGDKAGGPVTPLRTYMFYDIFPTNVSQIDLSYDTSDTIEEYTVEFQVQYWTAGSQQDSGGATDQTGISVS